MDPLTIGAAVLGLIASASRIGPLLYHFVEHTKDAPKTSSQIMDEINSVTAALEQLQVYLLDASTSSIARREMVTMRNLEFALAGCVTTYSDLELVVGKCIKQGKVKRIKWLINEGEIEQILQRLQGHKSSLTLMLTILQAKSNQAAEDSSRRLEESMCQLQAELKTWMAIDPVTLAALSRSSTTTTEDDTSEARSTTLGSQASSSFDSPPTSTFERDLEASKVYQRVRPSASVFTPDISRRSSLALSTTSELTLGDISAVSVCALPICSSDLSNAEHYTFGTTSEVQDTPFSEFRVQMYTANRKKLLSNQQQSATSREFSAALNTAQKAIAQRRARAKAKLDTERTRRNVPPIVEQTEAEVTVIERHGEAEANGPAASDSAVESKSPQDRQCTTTAEVTTSHTQPHDTAKMTTPARTPQKSGSYNLRLYSAACITGALIGAGTSYLQHVLA